MSTAILIDGAFFLYRYRALHKAEPSKDPKKVAEFITDMVQRHLKKTNEKELYRIFYYDAMPLLKKANYPISNKSIDFSKSEPARFRLQLFEELKRKRKVALRLGETRSDNSWNLRPRYAKELRQGKLDVSTLTDDHFEYSLRQKGVDMRIGIDITALAYKKLVKRIILVAGDSDFVPAAKVARREGIDFILDPMWHGINSDLFEHIDGLQSVCPKPKKS